jgi:4-amino-4-deoxy-L-arabinose transferase-like glycosyltransferase
VVVLVPGLFLNLEADELSLMEARNFVAAREMAREGHWLVPTMNGELRLAKPPLPTWITAGAALATGTMDHLPTLRFPAACMAAALVLFTFLLARQLSTDPLVPFLAALVLATSFAFVQIGRQGTWDIYCHAFMGGAIWLFVWGCRRSPDSYGIFMMCGLLAGCSFLSKGPVAFYAFLLPFLVAWYLAFGGHTFRRKKKGIAVAVAVCLLIALSWPAFVWIKVPQDLAAHVTQESTSWMIRHVRPFWFYWSFPVEMGIWTVFAAAALVVPYARHRIGRFGNYRLLASWVFLAVILLSVIPEKKERYLFPVLVPLALLTGHYLRYLAAAFAEKKQTRADYRLTAFTTGVLVLLCAAAPYLLYRFVFQTHYLTSFQYALTSVWMVGLGAALLYSFFKGRVDLLAGAMALLQVTVFVTGIRPYFGRAYINKNYQPLTEVRNIKEVAHLNFYALGGMPMEQVWEVGQRVDSLSLQAPAPLLPNQLPAALFSPTPLSSGALLKKNIHLQQVRKFHYRREDPAALYYLYILSPPQPAKQKPAM